MTEHISARSLIEKLRERNVSKWRIAKEINVSWQTVNLWDKGTFNPTSKHYEVLRRLAENG